MSPRASLRRVPAALAIVCVAGAALRFATLDVQSLWFDEAVTARLLRMDLPGLLRAIPDSESSPPLYYLLAWPWMQLFGTGEVGLRSLCALVGTATIPVVWALGRRLGGDRAGLPAAALTAINPMLIWFSQEARAYALLVLLGALSALLWLRALELPRDTRRLLAWGVVAALALATHYFAIFLIAPQALWLARNAPGTRARATAIAPPLLAALALAPLALGQRANAGAAFIENSGFGTRVVQIPKQFLLGYNAPSEPLLAALSALALVIGAAGLAWLLAAGPTPARGDAQQLAILAVASLALPLLSAGAGEDHVITRNVLATLPIVIALVGAGVAAASEMTPWPAIAATGAACLAGAAAAIGVAGDPTLQREDWRGAARALGQAAGGRVIVATPSSALVPLRYYLPRLRPRTGPDPFTDSVDYLALPSGYPQKRAAPPRPTQAPTPAPGMTLIDRTDAQTFTVLRLRAPTAVQVPVAALGTGLDGVPAVVLAEPPAG